MSDRGELVAQDRFLAASRRDTVLRKLASLEGFSGGSWGLVGGLLGLRGSHSAPKARDAVRSPRVHPVLETSSGPLEPPCKPVGLARGPFGIFWGSLGGLLGSLGALLEASLAVFERREAEKRDSENP